MSDAIGYVIQLFQSFISLVFNYFNFSYSGYTANLGWITISGLVLSILIGSLLNLPTPSDASIRAYTTRKVGGPTGKLPNKPM